MGSIDVVDAIALDIIDNWEEESPHAFVISRRGRAECSCGWKGRPTKDKRKSWRAHVKRVDDGF